MWIRLHNAFNGKEILIQTQHITTIGEDCREMYSGITFVSLTDGDEVHVAESYEETKAKVCSHEDCQWK